MLKSAISSISNDKLLFLTTRGLVARVCAGLSSGRLVVLWVSIEVNMAMFLRLLFYSSLPMARAPAYYFVPQSAGSAVFFP